MNEKKEEIMKELKSYLKTFTILILSGIPLYYELSFVKSAFKIENERLIWLLDLGFYTLIFSILLSCVLYFYNINRTNIKVKLYYTEEKLSTVTLENKGNKSIILEISIKGNRSHIPDKIILNYPEWLDVQVKGSNYTTAMDSDNQYHFDLQKMVSKQKDTQMTKYIPIDILGVSEEKNDIKIIPELTKMDFNKRVSMSIKIKGLKISLKGK